MNEGKIGSGVFIVLNISNSIIQFADLSPTRSTDVNTGSTTKTNVMTYWDQLRLQKLRLVKNLSLDQQMSYIPLFL